MRFAPRDTSCPRMIIVSLFCNGIRAAEHECVSHVLVCCSNAA